MKADIDALKAKFRDHVAALRGSYTDRISEIKRLSEEARKELNGGLASTIDADIEGLQGLVADSVNALKASNELRVADFEAQWQTALDAYIADVDAQKAVINAEVDKMIGLVKGRYQNSDKYHMKHLIKKLENWRAAAWAKLNERKESAK